LGLSERGPVGRGGIKMSLRFQQTMAWNAKLTLVIAIQREKKTDIQLRHHMMLL